MSEGEATALGINLTPLTYVERIHVTIGAYIWIPNVSKIWYEPKAKLTKTIEKSILSAAKRFEIFYKS